MVCKLRTKWHRLGLLIERQPKDTCGLIERRRLSKKADQVFRQLSRRLDLDDQNKMKKMGVPITMLTACGKSL